MYTLEFVLGKATTNWQMENKLLPHLLDQSLIPTMILSLRPTRQKHDFSATVHCNVLKEKSEEKTLVWPSLPGGQVLILT